MGCILTCIKDITGTDEVPQRKGKGVTRSSGLPINHNPRRGTGGNPRYIPRTEAAQPLLSSQNNISSSGSRTSSPLIHHSQQRESSTHGDDGSRGGLEEKKENLGDWSLTLFSTGKHNGRTYQYVKDCDWDYCKFILSQKERAIPDFYKWLLTTPDGKSYQSKLRVSRACSMKCPELKKYLDRVMTNTADKVHEPKILVGEHTVMARYGWFIDYVVRWFLYVECKKRGIPVSKFSCHTRKREDIATSLKSLLATEGHITDQTLRDLWVISFSSILAFEKGAIDISMPKCDPRLIEKITEFAREIANNASLSGSRIDMSYTMEGKLISGEADIIVGDCIIDIKLYVNNCLNMTRHWVQVLLYAMLRIDEGYPVNSVAIYDVNAGLLKTVAITEDDIAAAREFVSRVHGEMGEK